MDWKAVISKQRSLTPHEEEGALMQMPTASYGFVHE